MRATFSVKLTSGTRPESKNSTSHSLISVTMRGIKEVNSTLLFGLLLVWAVNPNFFDYDVPFLSTTTWTTRLNESTSTITLTGLPGIPLSLSPTWQIVQAPLISPLGSY
jgi:hypothetical protein